MNSVFISYLSLLFSQGTMIRKKVRKRSCPLAWITSCTLSVFSGRSSLLLFHQQVRVQKISVLPTRHIVELDYSPLTHTHTYTSLPNALDNTAFSKTFHVTCCHPFTNANCNPIDVINSSL